MVNSNQYFEHVREDIIRLVPFGTQKILDVGCGAGATGVILKKQLKVKEVIGIEFVPEVAKVAKLRLDKVIIGDIETLALDFPEGYFDCILCADILEHCRDPWSVLRKLRPLLSNNGVLIASIPNMRHIVVILKILFDQWEYEKAGILDETHLRFFTLKTMKRMFRITGFEIIKINANRSLSWKFKLMKLISLGLLKPFSVYQYLIVAQKTVS